MWPSQNAAVHRMYSSLGQAFCPRIGQDFGCGAEYTLTAQDECSGAAGPWMVEATNCLDPGRMQCGTVPCLQVANGLFSSLESTPTCLHLNAVCVFLCSPTLQQVAVS